MLTVSNFLYRRILVCTSAYVWSSTDRSFQAKINCQSVDFNLYCKLDMVLQIKIVKGNLFRTANNNDIIKLENTRNCV